MVSEKRISARQALLKSAKALIVKRGHEAVTARSLGEATGYAHTVLYHYFADMDALFWAVRLDMIEDMIAQFTRFRARGDDAVKELLMCFESYAAYHLEHPNVFRFFYFHSFVPPKAGDDYPRLEARFELIWQATFARLIQESVLDASRLPQVAKTMIYALHGMLMLHFSSNGSMGLQTINDELSRVIHLLLEGKQI